VFLLLLLLPLSVNSHIQHQSEHSCAVLWALSREGEGCDAACRAMRASIKPLIRAADDILQQGLELCASN
jgi:hypothetical protein